MGAGVGRGTGAGTGGCCWEAGAVAAEYLFGCAGAAGIGTGVGGSGAEPSLTVFGGVLVLGI